MVFPLLDEAESHNLALTRVQEFHPIQELERRPAGGLVTDGDEAIRDARHIHGVYFPRLLSIVTAEGVASNFEQPRAKQPAISNLRSFSVNRQHHFLTPGFG